MDRDSKSGCIGPGDEEGELCGRAVHAHRVVQEEDKALCKTHVRQVDDGKSLTSIQPYAGRRKGLVTIAGIKMEPESAKAIEQAAKAARLRPRAAIGLVVDGWQKRVLWSPERTAGVGAGALLALLAVLGLSLHCVHGPSRSGPVHDEMFSKVLERPLEGQARPPCEKPFVEKVGACWARVFDDEGKPVTDCRDSELMYEDAGKCYLPAWKKPPRPTRPPTSVEDIRPRTTE